MNLENEILKVLTEAWPEALPLKTVALNVFNMKNSLFFPLDYSDVYTEVSEWLRLKSSQSGSPVLKGKIRGWYLLNAKSQQAEQLMLEFREAEEDRWMY